MIYYSLSTLLLAGIREIVLISSPQALPQFKSLFGDGSNWGIKLSYIEQANPNGIAEALLLAENSIEGKPSVLMLGDNIFYGNALTQFLHQADRIEKGATVFSYRVSDPQSYGIVALDNQGKATSIEEKPKEPKSNLAVTGLYFYDEQALQIAKRVTPSARGELEITVVNQAYLEKGDLHVQTLYRGFAWFDAGTIDDLMGAADFVRQIEKRQGQKICCPEEICLNNGWITPANLEQKISKQKPSDYNKYVISVISDYMDKNQGHN